jgi:hypothetical protein
MPSADKNGTSTFYKSGKSALGQNLVVDDEVELEISLLQKPFDSAAVSRKVRQVLDPQVQ